MIITLPKNTKFIILYTEFLQLDKDYSKDSILLKHSKKTAITSEEMDVRVFPSDETYNFYGHDFNIQVAYESTLGHFVTGMIEIGEIPTRILIPIIPINKNNNEFVFQIED